MAPLWGQDAAGPLPTAPGETQARQSPAAPAEKDPKGDEKSQPQKQPGGTSKDRLFFTLPNFLTLEKAGQAPPLTTAQKFKVVARSSFDPVEYVWYGALAGISQAENSQPAYGQGAAGYAKRYAVRFADGTIEDFTSKAVFPALLHQDPRYFQLGEGGFWRRLSYAAERIVVTRSDSGNTQFNYSELLGGVSAAAISTYSYHLKDDQTVVKMMNVFGTQVGYDALSYMLKEFWPDLRRKLHKPQPTQTP